MVMFLIRDSGWKLRAGAGPCSLKTLHFTPVDTYLYKICFKTVVSVGIRLPSLTSAV